MRLACSVVTVIAVQLLTAAPAAAQEVNYERFKLDNGLTVIMHEDHSVPEVSLNLWYLVGSKDEPEGRSGFAHLFEHLMFMGTKRVPGAEFDQIMETRGGQNNASTSEDYTNYWSSGPSELLPILLWLEADRMEALGQTMTLAKLDKQRDVVRNERRQGYENRPYGESELRISEEMYPSGHPYRLPVIGSHRDLEAATVDDVTQFFETYYVPNNASLVIAGDFDPDLTRPLVERLFGAIPRGADPSHASGATAALPEPKRVSMTDEVQFARTTMVFHSPAWLQAGDAEMDLLADILADGVSSRLYRSLVAEKKLATDVSAYQESRALGSLFYVEATARAGVELQQIEAAIDQVLRELLKRGPSKRELAQKQAKLEYRALAQLQSIGTKANLLNAYQFTRGEPDSFRWDLDRYRQATPASVQRWAKQVLDPKARLVLQVLPRRPPAQPNPIDTRPALGVIETFEPALPQTFALSNGLTVHHWQRSELPLVKVQLMLPFGASSDPLERAGLAALTAHMLDEGTGALDAKGFAQALELLGASLWSDSDHETTTVELSALKRQLDPALALMRDAIIAPRMDPEEWQRVRRVHVEELRRSLDHPTVVANLVAQRSFFGRAHPYSRPADGLPESAAAVSLEEVRRFHAKLFRPDQAVLLVAGDLSAAECKGALETAFGAWRTPAEAPALQPPSYVTPKQRPRQLLIVDRPGAVQTVIQFVMPAPPYADPRRVQLELLNTVLGGSFTSRLNQNLREKHGFTYGARSSFNMEPSVGYFTASSSVKTEVTGAALHEFLLEFARLRKGTVTAAELRKARALRRMEVIETFSGIGGILWAGATLARNGRPFTELGDELRTITTLRKADLNKLARDAVALDQATLVLVGDKQKIVKQLKGLKLPKPVEAEVEAGAAIRAARR